MKKTTYLIFAVLIIFAAMGGGLFGAYMMTSQIQASATSEDVSQKIDDATISSEKTYIIEESQVIETVKKVSPSVVSVVISKDMPKYRQGYTDLGNGFNDPFFNFGIPFQEAELDENGNIQSEKVQIGGGSGFIISKDGLIVTNRHVVEDEDAQYTVITNDGEELEAEVLAKDTLSDFAVLKLTESDKNKIKNLDYVELGDSDNLQVGQKVIAIGNALAEYQNTVTTGIISGVGRDITAGSLRSNENLLNLIQTDAAINPGNSGGPLVNLKGQVVAINTAIAANSQGIGFAIPINDVKSLIREVQEEGKIIRPFLGVRFMMLDELKAKELQIDIKNGALLVGDDSKGEFAVAPGSPAEKAGLKMKDVILEIDGEVVNMDQPLDIIMAKKNPRDKVKLKVWRSGEIIEINVELGESK